MQQYWRLSLYLQVINTHSIAVQVPNADTAARLQAVVASGRAMLKKVSDIRFIFCVSFSDVYGDCNVCNELLLIILTIFVICFAYV